MLFAEDDTIALIGTPHAVELLTHCLAILYTDALPTAPLIEPLIEPLPRMNQAYTLTPQMKPEERVYGFGHLSTRTHGEMIEIFWAVKVVVGDHKAHPLTIGTRITFGHGLGSTGTLPTEAAR